MDPESAEEVTSKELDLNRGPLGATNWKDPKAYCTVQGGNFRKQDPCCFCIIVMFLARQGISDRRHSDTSDISPVKGGWPLNH